MEKLKNTQLLSILERTLNYIDPRLIDHGKQVSYIMFQLLKDDEQYSMKQLRDICIMSVIHDIGAYRTEEIDRMVRFETEEIWEHSIYGYLFLKEFSPIASLAPVLMFHHADCRSLQALDKSYHEIAQLLNMADRMDFFYQTLFGGNGNFIEHLERNRNIMFCPEYLDKFMSRNIHYPSSGYIDRDIEYKEMLNAEPFNKAEIDSYLWMIVLSIDFRSCHTVSHTLMTAHISTILAELLHYEQEDIDIINVAALLHDIGKSGIPIEILEAPRCLSEYEMRTMRRHVNMTEYILEGNIDTRISDIAIHHHEKLNGTGYPYKLTKEQISQKESIVAVADILSALVAKRSYKNAWPKDKIIRELTRMVESGELDSITVAVAVEHYDYIFDQVSHEGEKTMERYQKIMKEYKILLTRIKQSNEPIITSKMVI